MMRPFKINFISLRSTVSVVAQAGAESKPRLSCRGSIRVKVTQFLLILTMIVYPIAASYAQ